VQNNIRWKDSKLESSFSPNARNNDKKKTPEGKEPHQSKLSLLLGVKYFLQ
jgi:hypothetical protein